MLVMSPWDHDKRHQGFVYGMQDRVREVLAGHIVSENCLRDACKHACMTLIDRHIQVAGAPPNTLREQHLLLAQTCIYFIERSNPNKACSFAFTTLLHYEKPIII